MKRVEVRSARTGDLENLVALNRVVHDLHVSAEPGDFRADVDPAQVRTFFDEILGTPDTLLLIGELDGRVAGYAWIEVQCRPARPLTPSRRRLYVHHIVVSKETRRSGVASALLRASEEEARKRAIEHIALDTWIFNEEAHQFFRSAGFSPYNIVLRKAVS